ncbi:transcriptional regulator [Riemerella anatipestifer Yb2]|uniref:helix-turn-helix domain-containing protein n=1 Tax=Riemerella anatipestifer TaxID=34085 RepID=UPI0006ECE43F|nr:helix-turn-helix transcriptional regulator [Riemerella anatipestifer]AKQ39431.1 transcriptional regulator [Riemerella anatipestifer Yb2]
MNVIGLKIKELRKEKNLTQMEFSEKIGVDNSQLSKIEQGKLSPTLNQLLEISSIFNVSLDWLTNNKQHESSQSINIKGNRNSGIIGNNIVGNNGSVNIQNPTSEDILKQEIYRLTNEISLLKKNNTMLDREVNSFKEILGQYKSSQELIKELYERKIEGLKHTIDLLEKLLDIK